MHVHVDNIHCLFLIFFVYLGIENPYDCGYCQSTFGTRALLEKHTRESHANETKKVVFCCKICVNEEFPELKLLKEHMKTHHPKPSHKDSESEQPHICHICGRCYVTSVSLRLHLRQHAPKTHSCTICSRSYRENRGLKKHMLTHTGKYFKCCIKCS